MNKKGFTLIELLAVIVILSIIAVITTPIIINVMSNVRNELSEEQKQIIENAARMWGVKKLTLVKQGDNYIPSQKSVTVNDLKKNNYLEDKELKNLKLNKDELIKAGVCISYENQYIYSFTDNIENCDS